MSNKRRDQSRSLSHLNVDFSNVFVYNTLKSVWAKNPTHAARPVMLFRIKRGMKFDSAALFIAFHSVLVYNIWEKRGIWHLTLPRFSISIYVNASHSFWQCPSNTLKWFIVKKLWRI
jgi:hypothetical protein